MKSYEEVIQLLKEGKIYPRENNAKLDDRDFIGTEKEEDYCSIARARIEAIEPNLF